MQTDPLLLARARDMRRQASAPERKLWHALKAKRWEDLKVARQVVLGAYIVDFCIRARKLVIEVDGDTHSLTQKRDAARTAWLESKGYHVIRFTNLEVMGNLEGVLHEIGVALAATPLPTLSPGGRGLPGRGLE